MFHDIHFSLITEKRSNQMNVLRRLKSRGRKSHFGCQWISRRETSISLNCFKYLNKLLYKTEDVSAGHGLNKNDILVYLTWPGRYSMSLSGYHRAKRTDILKGVWLDETWFKTGLCFCPSWIDFLSCVQLQRWNNKKDTSEPLFWFSAGLWTINCFCQWTAAQCHVIVTSTRGENLPFQTAMVVVLISLVSLGLGVADCEGSDRRVTHFFVDTCRGNKT